MVGGVGLVVVHVKTVRGALRGGRTSVLDAHGVVGESGDIAGHNTSGAGEDSSGEGGHDGEQSGELHVERMRCLSCDEMIDE